jgi:hypothetical protein
MDESSQRARTLSWCAATRSYARLAALQFTDGLAEAAPARMSVQT